MGERYLVDDMKEDLEVCSECTDTWKVACYGAWWPDSQFWDDFLEDGWDEGKYTAKACCLRFVCGMLFCVLAPLWCCKAVLCFLCWPCICLGRAAKEGQCNKTYFRFRRPNPEKRRERQRSEPLAYIEHAQPTPPGEVPFYLTPSIEPTSPVPEIRIMTEDGNPGDYYAPPTTGNGSAEHRPNDSQPQQGRENSDVPPPYPMEGSPYHRWRSSSESPVRSHKPAAKTMSGQAKSMDNNLYRAVVLEGFQGISGKVTSV